MPIDDVYLPLPAATVPVDQGSRAMPSSSVRTQTPPFTNELPAPIFFRSATVPAHASYPRHRHPWGEFVYSFSGVMEVKIAGHHYLAPPHYGIWLPPDVEHVGLNRHEACHCSLYVERGLCSTLPAAACAVTVRPLMRSILDHLRQYPPELSPTDEEARLMRVLVDQLAAAECAGSYLPTSDDPVLGPILRAMEEHPGDNRPLAELVSLADSTERTVMRRCQRELGMSFAEWRQRLRVVKAMSLLEEGMTVQGIAAYFGYGSASAFIAMFRRVVGLTPAEYRKSGRGEAVFGRDGCCDKGN